MQKIVRTLLFSIPIFFFGLPSVCFAFEISDIFKFQSVAVKVMTKTDTIQPKRSREITGTKPLENLLGYEMTEYEADYFYISDKKLEDSGIAKWYYYYQDSWNGRGRGKFKYDKNEITIAARTGDLLVIGKNSDKKLTYVVIHKDHKAVGQVYEIIGMKPSVSKAITPSEKEVLEEVEEEIKEVKAKDFSNRFEYLWNMYK